jgi:heat shock protein HslJ
MAERWLAELHRVRTLEPSATVADRAREGSRLPDPPPSMGRRAIVIVTALAIAVAATSFAVTALRTGSSETPGSGQLTGKLWKVTSLPAYGPIPPGLWADATFKNGEIGGKDGCNEYGGPYSATSDGGMQIGQIDSNAIGCREPVGRFENAFRAALSHVASYAIAGDVLTLSDSSGGTVLRFLANAPPPLAGVTWKAFGYRDGPVADKQAVVNLVPGSSITAIFGSDGKLTGSLGCATYSVPFTIMGTAIEIGAPAVAPHGCSGSLKHQEDAYFAALRSARTWTFSGPSFQLLNSSRTVAVTYAPFEIKSATPPN